MSNTSDKPASPTVVPTATDKPDSSSPPKDLNIFTTIRNYADNQLTSILQSVFGLPSSTSAPKTSNWAVFDEQAGDTTPSEQDALRELAAKRTRSVSSGILEEVQSKQVFGTSRSGAEGGNSNNGLRMSSEIEAQRRNSESGRS